MIFWKSKKQKLAEQAKREQEEMRQQFMRDYILLYMLRRLEQRMQEQLNHEGEQV